VIPYDFRPSIATDSGAPVDNVIAGDSIFNVDVGSARADFPGGSASQLYSSKAKMFALPDHVKIWVGHDYPPDGRESVLPYATVAEHRRNNKHFREGITERDFIHMRSTRDKTLSEPKLLHQALQMNIRGGHLPAPNAAGQALLHLPLRFDGLVNAIQGTKL
jgi:glyoxylase-like metal-dependent hydrolase (beta-lactamase superfamily II)